MVEPLNSPNEIADKLKAASSILVLSHVNPDFDAYGSSCALTLSLQKLGKDVVCVNQDGILRGFDFIPGVSDVVDEIPSTGIDLVVYCDCGDRKRIGDRIMEALPDATRINIDHHASNDNFGDLNLVRPNASSTVEVLYEVILELEVELDSEIATCILAGLVGDTGSFRYMSTTAETFQVALKMMEVWGRLHEVAQGIFGNTSKATVRLLGKVFSEYEELFDGKVARAVVDKKMMEEVGASAEDCESLVEQLRDIEGIEVAVFIREEEDCWKGSLRSVTGEIDVSKIAGIFGGGGHKCAAGFRSRLSIEETLTQIEEQLSGVLK